MEITITGSHEAQDELCNLYVMVASGFTQTDINKLSNKIHVQGRKKGYHSIKIKKFLCESDLYWRKEVTVKLNFAIHNVKNEVSFSLCKYCLPVLLFGLV